MATKNLIPRANNEGKLGIRGASDFKWSEVNSTLGAFDTSRSDLLKNLDNNDLLVAGANITINQASGANGSQYTIAASVGASDSITENNSKVEVFDDNSAGGAIIKFAVDPANSGSPVDVWHINGSGHLIPQANETYDIGSAEKKVRHLFLSDNTIFFGGSGNTTPFHLGIDTENSKFRISTDGGSNYSNIALSSDLSSYATQIYVDNAIQGLDVKPSVRAATTGVLTGFTYNSTSQRWEEDSASGALTIDGIVLVNNDDVLVKNSASGSQNGIYTVSGIDGSSQVILDRTDSLDNGSDFNGAFTFVEAGTANENFGYVAKPQTSGGASVVGTNVQVWSQFSSAGSTTTLTALTDTSISGIANDQFLQYDSENSV